MLRFTNLPHFRPGVMRDEVVELGSREALLLQAGLWAPQQARGAWDEFCARIDDIEKLPNKCYDLFPLVAANLAEFAPTLPHQPYLQSVLKHSWARSQSLLASVLPVLQALGTNEVDFLVFKGMALTPLYYKNWGARSGMNIGLLIHPQDVERSFPIMARGGCFPLPQARSDNWKEFIRYNYETTWFESNRVEVQLRWHLIQGDGDDLAEKNLWDRAILCPLPGMEVRTLCATDHFLQTCVDGSGFNSVLSLAWLTDAAMILREGKIDWADLEERAHHSQRINAVRETILNLDRLDLGMPKPQAEYWRKIKAGALENIENEWRAQRTLARIGIKTAAMAYLRFNRDPRQAARWKNLWAYLKQLREVKGVFRRMVWLWYVIRWNRLRNTDT